MLRRAAPCSAGLSPKAPLSSTSPPSLTRRMQVRCGGAPCSQPAAELSATSTVHLMLSLVPHPCRPPTALPPCYLLRWHRPFHLLSAILLSISHPTTRPFASPPPPCCSQGAASGAWPILPAGPAHRCGAGGPGSHRFHLPAADGGAGVAEVWRRCGGGVVCCAGLCWAVLGWAGLGWAMLGAQQPCFVPLLLHSVARLILTAHGCTRTMSQTVPQCTSSNVPTVRPHTAG
jgi:hypothetical protein